MEAAAKDVQSGQVQNVVGQQALRELMNTLRGPNTPEQQNQILHILKSNPPLMAAFIRHRQASSGQQPANQHAGPRVPPLKIIRYQPYATNNRHVVINAETGNQQPNIPNIAQQPNQQQVPNVLQQVQVANGPNNQQVDRTEARKFSIQRCIQSLVHACRCKDVNCRLASCQRMKRVVQHIKTCKRRASGGCPVCKQLVALCCHHAMRCQENPCPVPFCFNIKRKLEQQRQRINEQPTKTALESKDALAESTKAMEMYMNIHGIGL